MIVKQIVSLQYNHFSSCYSLDDNQHDVSCLQELNDMRVNGMKCFRDIQVDESNILSWTGLIVPVRVIDILVPELISIFFVSIMSIISSGKSSVQ